ncbi:selenoprotein S isoform X1 [Mobula birostris]|uniref:selenoprotein S isoform X1 n=1 Tax=Mobula birostris TaxID=1983395 RepID=UPI003B28C7C5
MISFSVGSEAMDAREGPAVVAVTHVLHVLSEYGWYIFFSCVAGYFILQRIGSMLQLKSRQQARPSEAELEPSLIVRRQEAMEAARLRMQQELDAQAAKYKEKQKEIEEEKRREKIKAWENMQEGKSSSKKANLNPEPESNIQRPTKPKSDKKPLRGGFNPLTGDGGGSCSWRPSHRGPSAGA